jgi:hypothetical protein
MRTAAEDLNKLEEDIRDLKIEYDKYFGGGRARPPADIEWRIQEVMKRYGDQGATLSFSFRFRYTNLTQTYAKYQEIFRKRLKQKEEGIVQRHYGSAAREIERERALRRGDAPVRPDRDKPFPISISTKDPASDSKKVEELYAAFMRAKELAGEATDQVTLEKFQQFVQQKTDDLKKQKNAEEIEYVVSVEDKHARLKARVKS